MKVESVRELTKGQGKYGTWHLVECVFDGKPYKGFVNHVPKEGDDLDVEFFQKEYKGEMEDNFKIKPKPKGGLDEDTKNRLYRIEEYLYANNKMLQKLTKGLLPEEKPKIGNTDIDYPEREDVDVPF